MSDESKSLNAWLAGLTALLLMGWWIWMSVGVLEIKSQQQSIIQFQNNVVPPAAEVSMKEIRERMNVESQAMHQRMNNTQETIKTINEATIGHAKDIGYLRERLPKQ